MLNRDKEETHSEYFSVFQQNVRSLPRFFEKLELEMEKLAAQRQHIENNADNDIFQNQGYETLYNCVYIPPSLLNNDTSESLRNDFD